MLFATRIRNIKKTKLKNSNIPEKKLQTKPSEPSIACPDEFLLLMVQNLRLYRKIYFSIFKINGFSARVSLSKIRCFLLFWIR